MPEIYFILVEPAVPENIGAAARAIKTMGFSKLRLVNPIGLNHKKTRIVAHGANDILKTAGIFQSFNDAISDIDLVAGTTSVNRSVHHDYYNADELLDLIQRKGKTINSFALVFGREESGLTNDELARCHLVSYLPARTVYPSLNLAQAVMLYAYILNTGNIQEIKAVASKPDPSEFAVLQKKAGLLLTKIGFDKNKTIYRRFMERIAAAGCDDIHLMLSFINKLERKWPVN